jgi:ParB/RepB/Spo0J family partition protein
MADDHTPDLFGTVAVSGRRKVPADEIIHAAIDQLRGDAPIRSVAIGRLSRKVGGGKARLQTVRDAYADAHGETVIGAPSPAAGESIFIVPVDRLDKHPSNPRLMVADDPEIEALAASIVAEGQLLPVCVSADPGNPERYLVLDGFRRLSAIRRLVAQGHDVPVRAMRTDTDPVEFLVEHWSRQRNWSDYERAVFFVEAAARGEDSQAALALKAGLTSGGFSKAMAPARLPSCVYDMIADRRQIRVSDANRLLAAWKANEAAVRLALAEIAEPVSAKIAMHRILPAGLKARRSRGLNSASWQDLRQRALAALTRIDDTGMSGPMEFGLLRAIVDEIAGNPDGG